MCSKEDEDEDEDLRMEVEDLNDMPSDLGFKGLNFDNDVMKGKKMKQQQIDEEELVSEKVQKNVSTQKSYII